MNLDFFFFLISKVGQEHWNSCWKVLICFLPFFPQTISFYPFHPTPPFFSSFLLFCACIMHLKPILHTGLLLISHLHCWAHLHVVGMLRFMVDVNRPSLPTPFYSVLVSISVFAALSTVFHSINSPNNSVFSLCSSGLISALLVLSTIYLFMKVCFSPDITLRG